MLKRLALLLLLIGTAPLAIGQHSSLGCLWFAHGCQNLWIMSGGTAVGWMECDGVTVILGEGDAGTCPGILWVIEH